MFPYFIKRILIAVPTLLAVLILTFCAMKSVPGGPFDSEMALSAEVKQALENRFALNDPGWKQFLRYTNNVLHGDLGESYRYFGTRTVNEIISEAYPASLQLGCCALLIAIFFGIILGTLSAYYKRTWIDSSSMFFAVAGISLPNYLVASFLILVFSIWLGWLPSALWEDWRSMVLPSFALALRPLALIARMTRASLLETLGNDYIRTARAKGLGKNSILFKHALKNALVPILTVLGPIIAATLAGSFVIESIFAIPGLGKHFVSAVIDRDYLLIMGLTLVYGAVIVFANLMVDVLYGFADPRIRVNK